MAMAETRGQIASVVHRLEETFLGRCVRTFIVFQGVDRAMVIASQAFTALIPLLILSSALTPASDQDVVAEALVNRFGLSGDAAAAMDALFTPVEPGSVGILSVLLLLVSGVSLTRRMQRMYVMAWQLPMRTGVRATLNAALGLAVLVVEIALLYGVRRLVQDSPLELMALSVSALLGLLLWTSIPWLLLDRRVSFRRLLPGGGLMALATSIYGLVSALYMPRLMETYSERYGLFGVTIALVSWLLCVSFILVTATVIAAEFDRAYGPFTRRGSSPSAPRTPPR
jgi:membrane protein